MDNNLLHAYARTGALARKQELLTELEVVNGFLGEHKPTTHVVTRNGNGELVVRSRRSRMSAAARKAVSARMTRYWQERRKQAAAKKKG